MSGLVLKHLFVVMAVISKTFKAYLWTRNLTVRSALNALLCKRVPLLPVITAFILLLSAFVYCLGDQVCTIFIHIYHSSYSLETHTEHCVLHWSPPLHFFPWWFSPLQCEDSVARYLKCNPSSSLEKYWVSIWEIEEWGRWTSICRPAPIHWG